MDCSQIIAILSTRILPKKDLFRMFQIMVVEDDYSLRELMSDYLTENGYHVVKACDGEEALDLLDETHTDLLICDVMMPRMDGFTLTRELREADYQFPIMMVTAKETMADKREGFLSGADDYMVKPVDFEEMLLRVSALLRRTQAVADHTLQAGGAVLDYDALTVTVGDTTTVLPKKEMQLLFKLLFSPNQTFTRRQLMDEIWGPDSDADERTVDVHIKRLREKFHERDDFSIVTVRGLGYRAHIGPDGR